MSPQILAERESTPTEAVSRRTEANRRNALRSTGPRSEAGKDRSRRNALRSGLRARVVLPEEIRVEAERRVEDWTASRRPADEVERDLVVRAATAMTMLNRCWAELEAARLRSAVHAEGFWERERRAEVVEYAKKLKHAPESTVAKLRMSLQGAEWLIERWSELADRLRRSRDWTAAQRSTALDLLGVRPEFRDDLTRVDLPDVDPQTQIAHRLEVALVEIESLQADIREFLEESDEIDREIRMKHLVVGVDPEVRRLERYERQLDSRIHGCLKMLRELQEGRAAPPSSSVAAPASSPKLAPEPKPVAPPAPPPPPPAPMRRPPELGGPESLDDVLHMLPPFPEISEDSHPSSESAPPRDLFDGVPSAARIAMITKLLAANAEHAFMSEKDRADGEALLASMRERAASTSN